MFKQAFNVFKRTETVPLIKYVEAHTALVETQFKFYNAVIVLGGSFIVWSIDRERTHVDKRFEQVDKRLGTIESDLKEISCLAKDEPIRHHFLFKLIELHQNILIPTSMGSNYSTCCSKDTAQYVHCDKCNRCVTNKMIHCDKCNKCTHKDWYIHCDTCDKCVTIGWYPYCDKCIGQAK